ncbi:hypothetical protein A7982_13698 [Minicystis rosea]|nr:hypothetical protein A7982_13698 [Minicystis rosea]
MHVRPLQLRATTASALAVLLLARAAAAQPAPAAAAPPVTQTPVPSAALAATPPRDVATPDVRPDPWADVRRPWLYSADPTAPPPGHVMAGLGVGYAQVDRGAARPFAANYAHAGAVFNAAAEVGVFRFMSVQAEGMLSGEGADKVRAGGVIGLAFYPLPKKSPVDLSLAAGYLRELGGGNGVWGRASAAINWRDARFVVSAVGSHIFEKGRDDIDLLLTAGATYAILPILRVGVEYVVQDLEGAWEEDEADGGIRHFIGPTASIQLARRVYLTAGPAFGLSKGSPGVLGRMAASYAF